MVSLSTTTQTSYPKYLSAPHALWHRSSIHSLIQTFKCSDNAATSCTALCQPHALIQTHVQIVHLQCTHACLHQSAGLCHISDFKWLNWKWVEVFYQSHTCPCTHTDVYMSICLLVHQCMPVPKFAQRYFHKSYCFECIISA